MNPGDGTDRSLIDRAVSGDRAALQTLLERHTPFVFNLALKMFGHRADAEDLSQEVLVQVMTSLKTFRGESAFTTWLYRIAVNHFLKTRRRGMEVAVADFGPFFDSVAAVPDEDGEPTIAQSTVDELRVRCTTGMLMCLERSQRLIFILGAMFRISHTIGGEVLGISPGNFRIRLFRARKDLYQWMSGRCGLVNAANPCHCAKKAQGFVKLGLVDPVNRVFTREHQQRVDVLVREEAREVMEAVDDLHERFFREHPEQVSSGRVVQEILGSPKLQQFFDLAEPRRH